MNCCFACQHAMFTVHPKIINISIVLVFSSFADIGHKDVGLCCSKHQKTQQQRFFPEIMTRLLKIIHTPCCEQFHEGTIYFLPNSTRQPYRHHSHQMALK